MIKRPGGEMATRPLHFIWICDCSGSMSIDGKIETLNTAIQEALPHMRQVADENPNAEVFIRSLRFSQGAEWHIPQPMRLQDFKWSNLVADPLQNTTTADIIFMIDTSGSMGDEIETVKSNCDSFADHIIKEGANVRLGLVGFDIGGYREEREMQWSFRDLIEKIKISGTDEKSQRSYSVRNLSQYTIGAWPLASPMEFKRNIQSLSLGLFGGGGCYLANQNTVDIFPHVVKSFNGPPENQRILIIISDEMGDTGGLSEIVSLLKSASITAHVLGVPRRGGAHESIASMTGGKFWDIIESKGSHDFGDILGTVAKTIAKEMTKKLADGRISAGTDMGVALRMVADVLKIPPMTDRALPPVLVLISDGQPTDDFGAGLNALMNQPWGKKAVRIAIAIGKDADHGVLQKFISNPELKPLQANNPEALIKYIRWVSTTVLKSASSPPSQAKDSVSPVVNVPIPAPVEEGPSSASDVW
jgi:uncharacterized protein YegL